MPKTASTSLLSTLAVRHSLPSDQIPLLRNPWPDSRAWRALPHLHSDTRELVEEDVRRFGQSATLYKQHLLPTIDNVVLVANIPKIVLVRKPIDVVKSYRREALLTDQRPMMWRGMDSEQEWIRQAERTGLLEDLARFTELWSEDQKSLIVDYEEIVEDSQGVVPEIERWLGLPRREDPVALHKLRWGRGDSHEYRVDTMEEQRWLRFTKLAVRRPFNWMGLEVVRSKDLTSSTRNGY